MAAVHTPVIAPPETVPVKVIGAPEPTQYGVTVCVVTKVFRKKEIAATDATSIKLKLELVAENRTAVIEYFNFLLTATHNQIQKFHFGSPLSRAGAKGLKRNALIVIANQNLSELKEQVQLMQTPELRELAEWTVAQLAN